VIDAAVISEHPRLQRQPSICFRSPGASKQGSIDEELPATMLYENEEYEETPNGGS
jgi:hypothetical protein